MNKRTAAASIVLMLAGCVSNPSLTDIQASKPEVFNAVIPPKPSYCTLIPIKATNLGGTNYYKWSQADQSNSVIDPALKAKNDMETMPYNSYAESLNKLSSSYLQRKDKQAGKCVVSYLDEWARNDALLGKHTDMGKTFQKWLLADAAANYLKVRYLATSEQDERIKWWMKQVANSVKDFFDHPVGDVILQNHYAFTGAAVMQVGIITGDQENIDWGRKVFNQQVNTVTATGYLPQELDRKKQASRYHNFALQPLLYMAVLSTQIGEDWMANEKLQRLMTFTANANINVDIISKLVGEPAVPADTYTGWVALLPDSDPRRLKAKIYGFPDATWLGGNQELMRNLLNK